MKKLSCPLLSLLFIGLLFLIPSCTSDTKPKPAEEKEKGPLEVTVRLRGDLDRLNPMQTLTAQTLQVVYKIFPSLLQHDPFTLELSPMLAKERPEMVSLQPGEYDGDATHKYTFEIHDEAVWDNGQPVQASDYVFTLKAMFNPNVVHATAYRGALHFLKDVKIDASNPKKFSVYVKGVFRTNAGAGFYVIPEHVYDPSGLMKDYELRDLTNPEKVKDLADDDKMKAFGEAFSSPQFTRDVVESCGPYKLVSWSTQQEVILEKKKNWWGDALVDKYPLLTANPDKLVYKIIQDEAATVASLKSGELDIANKISPSTYLDFKESGMANDFNFFTPDIALYMYLGLNTKRPKFADKRVRRAIAHSVDVDKIMEVIQRGFASPAITPMPKSAPYFHKDLKRIMPDVEKAKALLKDAGWEDSNGDGVVDKMINGTREELVLQVLTTGSSVSKPMVAIIAEDAIKAGIKVEESIVNGRALFNEAMAKREFDAWLGGSGFDMEEFDPYQIWHTDSDKPNGYNRSGFGNAASNAMIEEIRNTLDESRRTELYLELQEMIYDEQPWVFLYYTKDRIIANKKLENVETSFRSPNYFENYFKH